MASALDFSNLTSLRYADPSKKAVESDKQKQEASSAGSNSTALQASNGATMAEKNRLKAVGMAEALIPAMQNGMDLEEAVEEIVGILGYSLSNEVLANDLLNNYYRNYRSYYKHRLVQLDRNIAKKKLEVEEVLNCFRENKNTSTLIEGKEIYKIVSLLLFYKDNLKHKKVKGGYISNLVKLQELVQEVASMEEEAGHIRAILETKKEKDANTQATSRSCAEVQSAVNKSDMIRNKAEQLEVVLDTAEAQTAVIYSLKTLYRAKQQEVAPVQEDAGKDELEQNRRQKLASIYAGIDEEAEKLINLLLEAESIRQQGINVRLEKGQLKKQE